MYCAPGEMENVLKLQVLDLHGYQINTYHMASHQLRMRLSTCAYLLLERVGLSGIKPPI